MRSLLLYFASRHTLANVFTLMVVLLGLGTLTHIQRDEFPSVDLAEMVITTRYPGASPQDVELNVTNKIEEELKEVDGLKRVTSFSMENISVVDVKIDLDAKDLDKVKTDVRDAVSRTSGLPPEVDEAPVVREITTATGIPIIEVGLSGDIPYTKLREYARRAEKALEEIPGVARLRRFGYRDREIHVEMLQDAMEKWQVSGAQIVNAIANRNIRSSGGSFESYTSEKNIVTLAQFETPLEVEDVIVDVTTDGTQVRIGDLAIVKDTFEPEKQRSRMNGQAAISFLVYKKETADIIRTVERIKTFVEQNQHRLPKSVRIEYSNDISQNVNNRLAVVMSNGALGLVLVLITLAIFLDLRSAIWVAMGIPVALLGTIFLLPMFGAYLDSIALGAMILVIGIIVDDGIVVAENIWRYREQGMAAIDAAVEGASAVFKPVITTLATTGLAFAPMFFMTGTLGDFIYVIPLVVILALVVSFGELTVALPAHLIWGVDEGKFDRTHEPKRLDIESIKQVFGSFLERLLHWRYPVIAAAMLMLVAAFWYAERYIDFVLFPTQSADSFYVLAELPTGASLDSTSDTMLELEALVEGLPVGEVESYVTRIGSHGDFNRGENEHWAYIGVFLTPFATRERSADMIVEDLRTRGSAIDAIKRMVFVIDSGGPPVGRPITIRVVGSDDSLRANLAALVVQRLEAIDGVKDIDRDDKRGKEQISIDIDFIRLADSALTVSDVARNVRLAFDGEIVTSVRYGDEDVDFRVLFEETARSSLDTLADLIIPNARDDFIRLEEVAEFGIEAGPSNVYHFDNERAITITADVIKELTTPLVATSKAIKGIDTDVDWPGIRLVVGGEAEESSESMGSLVVAFIAAAVGIYLLLLLLFDSTTQPVLVMIAIPFGLVGVIVAFALHGQAFGFLAMLGVVGLTGIVVNDSLILVNLVNRLGKTHPEINAHERIIGASKTRLRPIVLTSVTTVAGLLPMAYGLGGSDPFSAPMALAMGYGILFATPITLMLIPCLLAVLDDLHLFSRRFLKRLAVAPN
ncbi:MAG: efflux RND transporter permease subunit [Gammaproteobacteria bacterium]|nr:efflux RND transporter permease subunit [Gammaproteobacteria bacterium]